MSYNATRYLNFLTAVEALSPAQRATVDDTNPIAAYPSWTGPSGQQWVEVPGPAGLAHQDAYHSLINALLSPIGMAAIGGVDPSGVDRSGWSGITREQRAAGEVVKKNNDRLLALGDPGRVRFAFDRAAFAALLKDFPGRATAAGTVYAPVEALIPFASL